MDTSVVDFDQLLQAGYRYALSLSQNSATAEDLLQDAWVAVLKAKGPSTKAYLFSAIRSRFLNLYKREQLLSIVPLEDEHHNEVPEVDHFSENFDIEIVEDALNTLRSTEREALFLNAVEGYTAQEVADLTLQPRGSVLSLIHRAKTKIKRYVKEINSEAMP